MLWRELFYYSDFWFRFWFSASSCWTLLSCLAGSAVHISRSPQFEAASDCVLAFWSCCTDVFSPVCKRWSKTRLRISAGFPPIAWLQFKVVSTLVWFLVFVNLTQISHLGRQNPSWGTATLSLSHGHISGTFFLIAERPSYCAGYFSRQAGVVCIKKVVKRTRWIIP